MSSIIETLSLPLSPHRSKRLKVLLWLVVACGFLQIYRFRQFDRTFRGVVDDEQDEHNACSAESTTTTATHKFTLAVNGSETRPFTDFLTGTGLDVWLQDEKQPVDTAVCEWYTNSGTNHFPHEMEQLYRCWSWWNAHRQRNPDTKLVLYRHADAGAWRFKDFFWYRVKSRSQRHMKFCRGFVTAISAAFGVQVVSDETVLSQSVRKGDQTVFGGYAYRMRSAQDARDLAAGITRALQIPVTAGCSASTLPRVAILNRGPSARRSIINADAVAAELQQALARLIHPVVPVEYFESTSFAEQVAFFSGVDLLISSHGAQLTGLPFLPGQCGAVLEVFPKNYYYQQFFGSLAEAAGVKQYTLYLSNTDAITDFDAIVQQRGFSRREARQVNICLEPHSIVEAVKEMVSAWHLCCQQTANS
jgi:Glycosyltransferase 61